MHREAGQPVRFRRTLRLGDAEAEGLSETEREEALRRKRGLTIRARYLAQISAFLSAQSGLSITVTKRDAVE